MKKGWKPIESYSDLYGIEERQKNQAAFRRFQSCFGWTSYMFEPVVYDYKLLLSGSVRYDRPAPEAFGFARLPDRTLDKLCSHVRVFRRGDLVMLTCLVREQDEESFAEWCRARQFVYRVCDQEHSFHRSNKARLVLCMNEPTATRLQAKLLTYGA